MITVLRGLGSCLLLAMVPLSAAAERDRVVADQSFAASFKGFGAVRFVSLVGTARGPAKCAFELRRAGKAVYRFPESYANQWSCERIAAVAFRDMNGDGTKDVVVIAQAISGIGPTAARPFDANTVYYNTGQGRFVTFEKVNMLASKHSSVRAVAAALARSPHARIPAR